MKKKSLASFIVLGIVLVLIIFGTSLVNILTDWYWFQSINYQNIFKTIVSAKLMVGFAVGFLFFLFLYSNILIARKIVDKEPSVIGQNIFKKFLSNKIGKTIYLSLSLILSFFIGLISSSSWEVILKYFNATSFNKVDPILGKDISYYIFSLPFINFVIGVGLFLVI